MTLQQVTGTLQQLIHFHTELIDVAKEKQAGILANDISIVSRCVLKETKLIKKINEVEEERTSALYSFLREKGIQSQLNLNITEMARLVFDPDDRQHLMDLKDELYDLLTSLKAVNAVNKEMVEQSLTFIDYSMNLFTNHPEDHMVYHDPSKQKVEPVNRSYFDTRA
ncbi:flagellar protein FlgN [Paenibacillus massiliensis]|uniref:flagellar protein FlgN n=1 Tax=Paenibacillus massiliensis TaxID=225917 RepID=UPI0003F72592|nr:flagellar protein FlgN [Paenibacillus massiliensis]